MMSESTGFWDGKDKEDCMINDKGVRNVVRCETKTLAAGSLGNVKCEAGSWQTQG